MKITRIETYDIALKLKKPFKNANMIREKSSNTVVKIETDEGISGYGSATFAHFFAGETQGSVHYAVDRLLSPALRGSDPTNIASLVDKMDLIIVGNPFAKATVEMAMWDIKGKALGVPVCDLFGGSRRRSIPVNHSLSYGSVDEMAQQALEHVGHGFASLKIYCGREGIEADLERIRAIRGAVGTEVDLYVELNQRWDFKTTLRLLPKLVDLDILFLEQPISSCLYREMRILRERSPIPIAVDEGVFSPRDVAWAADQGVADIVNIYVLKAGGMLNARSALDVADAVGLDAFIGSFNELSISNMASAHLSATIKALKYPCYLVGPSLYEEDIVLEPVTIKDGMLHLSDRPGLGIEVDEDKLRKFQI